MDGRTVRDDDPRIGGFGRRAFLSAGGAALLGGGLASLFQTGIEAAPHDPIWIEKSIPELQSLMATGGLTSRELTQGYLERIGQLNSLLQAVIETNPQAVSIAVALDAERRRGTLRGPLHGIPILVKDN